jgi:hypothetical protein
MIGGYQHSKYILPSSLVSNIPGPLSIDNDNLQFGYSVESLFLVPVQGEDRSKISVPNEYRYLDWGYS